MTAAQDGVEVFFPLKSVVMASDRRWTHVAGLLDMMDVLMTSY
jgi:hypothetical protein